MLLKFVSTTVLVLLTAGLVSAADLLPAQPGPPAAAATVGTMVTVTWAPVPNADGYRIYRQTGSGPWVRSRGSLRAPISRIPGSRGGLSTIMPWPR